jgi:GntR family transcriptional regulator
MERADFDDVVVFRSVERHLGIRLTGARITVRAEAADEALAELLDYEVGAPVLVNQMLYYGPDGAPVELTVAQHPADRYSLTYDLR